MDDLDFPAVTVCPAKGSNTALNPDLMQMNNSKDALSAKQKEKLKEVIWKSLVEKPHKDFAKRMIAATEEVNLKKIFEGHYSVAGPYGESGQEIMVQETMGTIKSPGFKGHFEIDKYKTDRDMHVILELPENIKEQVGSKGSLLIKMEFDSRHEDVWMEYLQFSKGAPKYKFYWLNSPRDGYASELGGVYKKCLNEGGRLVPFASDFDKKEIANKLPSHSVRLKRSPWGYTKKLPVANIASVAKKVADNAYKFLDVGTGFAALLTKSQGH